MQENPTLAVLQWDKAPTEIPNEYSDYADASSSDLAMELFENTGINEHAIELIDGKQSPLRAYLCLKPIRVGNTEDLYRDLSQDGFYSNF